MNSFMDRVVKHLGVFIVKKRKTVFKFLHMYEPVVTVQIPQCLAQLLEAHWKYWESVQILASYSPQATSSLHVSVKDVLSKESLTFNSVHECRRYYLRLYCYYLRLYFITPLIC